MEIKQEGRYFVIESYRENYPRYEISMWHCQGPTDSQETWHHGDDLSLAKETTPEPGHCRARRRQFRGHPDLTAQTRPDPEPGPKVLAHLSVPEGRLPLAAKYKVRRRLNVC